MGLFDFFSSKKKKESQEAMKFIAMYAQHQAESREGSVDADELPNGVGLFGLVVTNPIPTRSVTGSEQYLSNLKTLTGVRVKHHRLGSTSAKEITNGMIDMYRISAEGQEVTIYLCPYHKRNSGKAPAGFMLS